MKAKVLPFPQPRRSQLNPKLDHAALAEKILHRKNDLSFIDALIAVGGGQATWVDAQQVFSEMRKIVAREKIELDTMHADGMARADFTPEQRARIAEDRAELTRQYFGREEPA